MPNPDLAAMLDQICTIYRSTEGVEGMVTKMGTLSAVSTGVSCHLHVQTFRGQRDDVARGYGYQDVGDHWWFGQSTEDAVRGDLIRMTSGPYSGQNFWVRGPVDDTDVDYIEHLCLGVEYTDETLTLST